MEIKIEHHYDTMDVPADGIWWSSCRKTVYIETTGPTLTLSLNNEEYKEKEKTLKEAGIEILEDHHYDVYVLKFMGKRYLSRIERTYK